MGVKHGAVCVGCCWVLMLVLFLVGLESLVWMCALALVAFAEKVLPGGDRLSRDLGVGLVAVAAWIALAPATVPGVHRASDRQADDAHRAIHHVE